MTTDLIIIRHGNTFEKGESPRRIGCHTDLALSKSGLNQITVLADHLKQTLQNPPIHLISSPLLRTRQSAEIIASKLNCTIAFDERFKEIDYGVDENQPEDKVLSRIGKQALEKWDQEGIVPQGWICHPPSIQQLWVDFAKETLINRARATTIVLTSNGCARFATAIDTQQKTQVIKLKTAHYMHFSSNNGKWTLKNFNESYAFNPN